METVPSNERIHGIKPGVAEESHPQVEIANIAVSGVPFIGHEARLAANGASRFSSPWSVSAKSKANSYEETASVPQPHFQRDHQTLERSARNPQEFAKRNPPPLRRRVRCSARGQGSGDAAHFE
jgi:hypothetical protein